MNGFELLMGGGLGYFFGLLLMPFLLEMLRDAGATRPNYRNETIPVGTGILFVFVYLLASIFLLKWHNPRYIVFLLGLAFFCLLGLIDDLLGSRSSRGFKGHFASLMRGRLTTGALKALGGGIGAILISLLSFPQRPWWEILTSALLIALAANTLNLFDLRPGRAVKVFFLWFLILLPAAGVRGAFSLLAPLAGSVLAYTPHDLKARAMLGDAGSNLLGAALGMATAWTLSFFVQLAVVGFLLLLHVFTEKYSLTEIIERNRVLHFLDRLGRDID